MSTRTSRLFCAVTSAVRTLRQSLADRTTRQNRLLVVEPLEDRTLFTNTYTGEFWAYKPSSSPYYCGPFYYTVQVNQCPPSLTVNDGNVQGYLSQGLAIKFGPVSQSAAPVQYYSGQPVVYNTDLQSSGFGGTGWSQTRSWNTAIGEGPLGPGWDVSDWTHLVDIQQTQQSDSDRPPGATDTIAVVETGGDQRWFDSFDNNSPHSYTERLGGQDKLVNNGTNFILYDSTGGKSVYSEIDSTSGTALLQSYTDGGGNVTNLSYDGSNRLTSVIRSNGSEYEKWTYSWTAVTDNAGNTYDHLASVTLNRSNDGGSTYAPVQSVVYSYYGGSTSGGPAGYLKTATIEDANSNAINTWAYRYYNSGDAGGNVGDMKMLFNPQSYSRAVAAGYDPTAATDANLQTYATNYFKYDTADSGNRVSWEQAQGAGCSCSAVSGQGVYTYSYEGSGLSTGSPPSYNVWQERTVIGLPDGNQEVVYTNAYGQPMLDVKQQLGTPDTNVTGIAFTGSALDVSVTDLSNYSAGNVIVITGAGSDNGTYEISSVDTTHGYLVLDDSAGLNDRSSGIALQKLTQQSATYYQYHDSANASSPDAEAGQLVMQPDPSAVNLPLNFTAMGYYDPQDYGYVSYDFQYPDLMNFSSTTGLAQYLNTTTGLINTFDSYFSDPNIGWNFSGPAGITANNSAISGTTTAENNSQAGFILQGGSMSQTLSFASAGTYSFSFYAAQRANVSSSNEQLQVTVDGTPVGSPFTPGSTYGSDSVSVSIPSSGTHTIGIIGSYSTAGSGALVDNVALSGSGAPALSDTSFETPALAAHEYVYDVAGATATSTTPGGAPGRDHDSYVQQGQLGAGQTQETKAYFAQPIPNTSYYVYPQASDTKYTGADGSGALTTNYAYTFYSGTDQPETITETGPAVASAQNGPGASATSSEFLDQYGRVIWSKDGDGYVNYTAYDNATGAVTETITDVDYNKLTSAQQTSFNQTGWAHPTGGLSLVTNTVVDGLGRPHEVIDPNGNITVFTYNDANHETRVYPGWNPTTGTTTGPIEISREYRPTGTGQTLYEEAMTELPPSGTSIHLGSDGLPDGQEAIGTIYSLSRQLTNNSNQVVENDDYFSLSGVTYSTSSAQLGTASNNSASGNYSATTYWYNERGNLARTLEPTGTIFRTVYDYLQRPVSRWEGTNDTPASGYWSPTNNNGSSNMVDIEDLQYDNGGVGDGNLTSDTKHVDNTAADDQVTLKLYDWRDRLIATKQGALMSGGSNDTAGETDNAHRLINYYSLDNLGQMIGTYTYAGDGVSLSDFANGLPTGDASKLRTYTAHSYDSLGQLYQTRQYSVDPTSGAYSTSVYLATNYIHDRRGDLIEEGVPGGLVYKHQYDGAGRDIKDSTTDGSLINGGSLSWTDANDSTNHNDVVVEQALNSYDPNGNLIESVDRQRFDNDPTTATGDLAGTSGGNLASRDYYTARYYDAANRQTDSVNVGTNHGSAWTRPSSVPAGSATVLVTRTDYDSAGNVLDTIDPRGIKSGTFHDMLGRQTETIAAWDGTQNPTPTNSTNQITQYTYDGNGDVLTMTAVQPSGGSTPNQTTAHVYGVGSSGNLFSNDLVAATEYPDPTTGLPSSSSGNEEQFGYNRQGQKTSYVMRDTTTHQYLYDPLGRLTADYVSQFGANVDQTIQRLGYSFNDAGLPFQQTSYSDAAGTTVANQVQETYNGYGQLTNEYQAHSGAVNTSSTPQTQYVYSQPTGANYSRLSAMVYPNGRQLNYNYTSTLDSAISRIDQLADASGTYAGNDQSYLYMGLSTVVQETDGNGGALSYIQQSGESNVLTDGGDRYTGLDRFGRVIDQNWFNTSTGVSTDRFQYGYDQDGNVLYKNNLVNSSFSELYHANSTTSGDDSTAYDPLNRMTAFSRGTLSASSNNGGVLDTIASASTTNSWSLDALGNWTATQNGTQTRSFNAQNQITGMTGGSSTFYNNGDMISAPSGNRTFYDAWNRAAWTSPSGVYYFHYDALGRLIYDGADNPPVDLYYGRIPAQGASGSSSVIEERDYTGAVLNQYVWGLAHVNDLALYGGGSAYPFDVQQDANWNVTSTVRTDGTVSGRIVYDPYGSPTVLKGDWTSPDSSVSVPVYRYQGGRWLVYANLYYFGSNGFGRLYDPSLGVWMQEDPKGYVNGANLYQIDLSNPVGQVDPSAWDAMMGGGAIAPRQNTGGLPPVTGDRTGDYEITLDQYYADMAALTGRHRTPPGIMSPDAATTQPSGGLNGLPLALRNWVNGGSPNDPVAAWLDYQRTHNPAYIANHTVPVRVCHGMGPQSGVVYGDLNTFWGLPGGPNAKQGYGILHFLAEQAVILFGGPAADLFGGPAELEALEELLAQPTQLSIDPAIVDSYMAKLAAGEDLPAIDVVELPDGRQFIIDGHHRFIAGQQMGMPVDMNVQPGEGPVGFDWDEVEWESFSGG